MLITESPSWLILFCLLAGLAVAMILYWRNTGSSMSKRVRILLALVRFIAVSLMAFLLLDPMVKRLTREKELPVIVVALDNSESMLLHSRDTTAAGALLRMNSERLVGMLSKKYKVETFSFGEAVSDTLKGSFSDKETDISSLFTTLETQYAGRNTGAWVIISDGIYNRGFSPVSLLNRINHPVYTIAWGDTAVKRDLILAEVKYNRVAYLGNSFPMEIAIKANRCNGLASRLIIRNREKVLYSQPVTITGEHFSKIVQVQLNAEKEGIIDFDIRLEPVASEVILTNNRTRAFIEVLTSKKKILLLSNKPHPDLGAMYNALLFNDMVEASQFLVSDFKGNVKGYDLVILHQLPEDPRSADLFSLLVRERVPMMIVGGGKTRHDLLSAVAAGPGYQPGKVRGQHNEALAAFNSAFALFKPTDDMLAQLDQMPPLYVPFGRYLPVAGEQRMFFQRIGAVTTTDPLISFYQLPGNRVCHIAGEGLWKWRMISFRNKKTHKPFDTFFNQMIQYLTASEDKTRFRVTAGSYFSENENITFTAELYDAAFNPVVEPEVMMEISGTDDQRYTFTFTGKESFYTLDAGRLPIGEYSYRATTALGAERFAATGRFVVAPLHIESTVTTADHGLLRTISGNTGAISVGINDIDKIIEDIHNRQDIKTVSHLREKYTDLTTVYWLLGLLLLLLAVEWFVRKREGSY